MACGDVLSLEDLQTAKKHQIFEAEVITGKAGGVAGGATIGTATNMVTGQTQQTLPSILADLGFDVQSWTSSTGGVLASANQVFLNDTPGSLGLGDYYAWGGPFEKTVPAGTDPALPGSGYILRSNKFVKTSAREALKRTYAIAGYAMVDGSFEEGGILTKPSEILLHEAAGKAYSWTGAYPLGQYVVPPGSTPVGAAWVDRSGLNPGAGVVRNGRFAMRDVVSVMDYATGDGVADDTAAIVAAMAALPATGGTVLFPRGVYLYSSTITINKPLTFEGEGCSVTNVNGPTTLLKAASLNGPGVVTTAPGAKIKSLTARGVTGNGGDGIVIKSGRMVLEDVGVFNMGRDGVRVGDDANVNANLWNIRNLHSKNNGRHGLHISEKVRPTLPDANGGLLMHADLQKNGECGLYLGNNILNTFVGLVVQDNGTYGVLSTPSSGQNLFYGGDYEINGRNGASSTGYLDFFIQAGSKGNTIFGGSSFNFPQSFRCDEPENMIVGFRDGLYAGDDKYAGMQFFNQESPVPTVLDWYEEGTFTPVLIGLTTAGEGTYTAQAGTFTRIGNTVRFNINLKWTAHTGTGNMQITGLPFLSANIGFQPVNIVPAAMTTPAGAVVNALVVGASQAINIYSILTGGNTTFAPLAMDTAASCWISGTYQVA